MDAHSSRPSAGHRVGTRCMAAGTVDDSPAQLPPGIAYVQQSVMEATVDPCAGWGPKGGRDRSHPVKCVWVCVCVCVCERERERERER